jgi:hypothetical protein
VRRKRWQTRLFEIERPVEQVERVVDDVGVDAEQHRLAANVALEALAKARSGLSLGKLGRRAGGTCGSEPNIESRSLIAGEVVVAALVRRALL